MADNDTPADDLRSILSASFDDTMTSAAPLDIGASAKPAIEPEAPKPEAAAEPKEETRERGPDGKFLKKEGEAEAIAKPESDKSAADSDKPKAETDKPKPEDDKPVEAKPTDAKDPPANWTPSDKAMFKLQSPDAQAFLLRRHSAMEADYTKKVGAVAELKKEFGPIEEMFKPHLEVLKGKGLTPASTIRAWANVETALANGRGVDVVAGMIKGYNIDKAQLAKALGFTSTGAAEPGIDPARASATTELASAAHQPIQLPPELAAELRELRAKIDARDQAERNAQTSAARDREAKVESDITNFKTATNEKGELKHPYYEEVEPAMIALAQSYVASKQPLPDLSKLYETAVWANPSTREVLLASQKQAEQSKAAEEARAKAASARRAGSSVTGAPGSGQATKPIRGDLTLREQLDEAAADLA